MRLVDRPTAAASLVAGVFAGLAIGVKYPALVLVGTARRPALPASLPASILANEIGLGPRACPGGGVPRRDRSGGWCLVSSCLYLHRESCFPVLPEPGSAERDSTRCWRRSSGRLRVSFWNLLTAHRSAHARAGPVRQLRAPVRTGLPALPPGALVRACAAPGARAGDARLRLPDALPDAAAEHAILAHRPGPDVGRRGLPGRSLETAATVPARVLTLGPGAGALPRDRPLDDAGGADRSGSIMGRESFHEFLGRCEPTYRVGRWVSTHLPVTARLIGQDHRGFYIPRGYTMELAHRRRTGLGGHGESPREIVNTLKKEGYTHVMLCPPARRVVGRVRPDAGPAALTVAGGPDAALSRGPDRLRRRGPHVLHLRPVWMNDWVPAEGESVTR